MSRWTAIKRR